jgi:hypothetical protein
MHVLISGGCATLAQTRHGTDRLYPLTSREEVVQNPDGTGVQPGAALSAGSHFLPAVQASPGLKEIVSPNE